MWAPPGNGGVRPNDDPCHGPAQIYRAAAIRQSHAQLCRARRSSSDSVLLDRPLPGAKDLTITSANCRILLSGLSCALWRRTREPSRQGRALLGHRGPYETIRGLQQRQGRADICCRMRHTVIGEPPALASAFSNTHGLTRHRLASLPDMRQRRRASRLLPVHAAGRSNRLRCRKDE